MAQVPVFVVVKGDEDIKRLTGAVEQMAAKTAAANAQSSKMSGILSGVAQGVGIAGFLSVASAVSTVTDVLSSSVAAAMESERVERSLAVTLRDNIPAWKGNTDAINAAIEARKRLSFDDEDLAQSIGTLVAATHNEKRAIELLDLAMNIARFRNIDLASATDMVAKAASGSMKALNAAIPATRGAANATAAIEIAMKATAGQAEEYAGTLSGRVEGASNRFEDAQERLGADVMPIVTGSMELAVGAIDALQAAAHLAIGPLAELGNAGGDTAEQTDAASRNTRILTAEIVALLPPSLQAAANLALVGDQAGKAYSMEELATLGAYDLTAGLDAVARNAAAAAYQMALYRGEATSTTTAVKLNTAGSWTAATAQQALALGLKQSSLGASKARTEITGFGGSLGGASRATRDFSAAVERSFDAMKTKVFRAIDAIHQKNLDAIEDARRTANQLLDQRISALQGAVDAEQAKLDAARDAARKADLEAAVAQAATAEERARAQAELDDFLAQQRIDRMQADADAQIATLEAEKDSNDQKAEDAKKAEEARYEAQKKVFEREITALETHLKAKKITWDKANAEILRMLDEHGLDYETVGKKLGTKYADGFVKGVNKAIGSIAAAVAKYLGLDDATVRRLAAGAGPAPIAATDAATATASQGAPTAPVTSTVATGTANAAPAGPKVSIEFNPTINVGAFLGTEADAKRFAAEMWDEFEDETNRRMKVWPPTTEWRKVKEALGI